MRVKALLVVSALASVLSRPASAEVFHDAEVKPPGAFEVGFEGQFEFDPGTEGRVFGHAGVGIYERMEIHAKAGLLNRETNYFGGELRYGAIENGDGYPALMAYAGGHWIDVRKRAYKDFGGLDGGLTLSETIYDQSFYVGYDVDADFVPEFKRILFHQHILGGVKIPISDHLSFFVEGGYGVPTNSSLDLPAYLKTRSYISGGAALYF